MSVSSLNAQFLRKLFLAKHAFRGAIKNAILFIPERQDWDGKCRIDEDKDKICISGKIDVVAENLKFNNIYITFLALSDNSISFQIKFEDSIKMKDPDSVERALTGIELLNWQYRRDGNKINFTTGYEIKNDDIAKMLLSKDTALAIHEKINNVISEGKKILMIISENGGKKKLFG